MYLFIILKIKNVHDYTGIRAKAVARGRFGASTPHPEKISHHKKINFKTTFIILAVGSILDLK